MNVNIVSPVEVYSWSDLILHLYRLLTKTHTDTEDTNTRGPYLKTMVDANFIFICYLIGIFGVRIN